MAANHDLISAINPAKELWTIKARVVRLWFVSDFNRQALPFSMEMVLMDENCGDKMQASVRKSLIYRFERDLMEGSVYSMSYFGVASNAGSFRLRVIDHSDSATFVDFDRDATALLKSSCSEMVDSVDKVELNSGVNTRFEQSYRMKKLCADEVVIQKFIPKFPSLDVVVQEGPSGESVAQDLMPKFVDVVVHTQPQYTDPKIDVVGTDSVALNPADVDVCGDH